MAKTSNKQAHLKWELFKKDLARQTTIPKETAAEKRARITKLEKRGNEEAWFRYYFPNYYKSDSASFHRSSSRKLLAKGKQFIVRAWARELAKDTRTMFDVFYLIFVKKESRNILLVSHTVDNASALLEPFKINLESNRRLINDYGLQKNYRNWASGSFTTLDGVGFTAFGAGQSPRGTRLEDARPDTIIVTDIDTDEAARNAERINDKYKWFEEALIPTVSVSGNWRIIWLNNIIAKHCCTTLAMKKANTVEVVNIRNLNGKSTWPAKNSEEDIDALLNTMSYNAAQQEYFNNPITKGSIFKEMTFGAIPRKNQIDFIIHYGDPSPSNSESKKSSFKVIVSMCYHGGKYYILDSFVRQCGTEPFVEAFYTLNERFGKIPQYNYIENNSLQNSIFEQVYMPKFQEFNQRLNRSIIPISDDRKKVDKFARVEAALDPLVRTGNLVLNTKLKDDNNMQRLEEQFLNFNHQLSAHADAPDAVEGCKFIIDEKRINLKPDSIKVINPKKRRRHGIY